MKNHKYHDALSESLGIENDVETVDRNPAVRNTMNKDETSEVTLFDQNGDSAVQQQTPQQQQEDTRISLRDDDELVKDVQDDYNEIRATLYKMMSMGQESLQGILELAQESDQPRAYEVVAITMKNVADISDKLMKLHTDMQDVENKKNESKEKKNNGSNVPQAPGQSTNTTNNNVFVGSTKELQDMLDRMMKKQ